MCEVQAGDMVERQKGEACDMQIGDMGETNR